MNSTLYTSDVYEEITDIIYEYGIIFQDEEEYEESELDYDSAELSIYHLPPKETAYA